MLLELLILLKSVHLHPAGHVPFISIATDITKAIALSRCFLRHSSLSTGAPLPLALSPLVATWLESLCMEHFTPISLRLWMFPSAKDCTNAELCLESLTWMEGPELPPSMMPLDLFYNLFLLLTMHWANHTHAISVVHTCSSPSHTHT